MAARLLSQRVEADQASPQESLRKPLTERQRQVAWYRMMTHLRVVQAHADSGMLLMNWDAMMERKKAQAQLENTRHGGKAPAVVKQSHHAKYSAAMSKGAVIAPKGLPSNQASWQAWRIAKAACPHLTTQVTHGGNCHALWYRCNGCGERWTRYEQPAGLVPMRPPPMNGPPPKAAAPMPELSSTQNQPGMINGPLGYQVQGPIVPQQIPVAKHAFHGTSVLESMGPAELQQQMQALMQFQQQQYGQQLIQQAQAAAEQAAIANAAVAVNQVAATMPGNGENWIMAEPVETERETTTDVPPPVPSPLFQANSTEGEIRAWIRQAYTTMTGNNVTPHDAAMYLTAQAQQSNQDAWLRDQVVSLVQHELGVIGLAGPPSA